MQSKTQKIVYASMLAALCCVATMLIKIPSPFKGYLNMGDSIVLLAGWVLSPLYGIMAAGIGSCMADLFLGYGIYAPATFVIKGLMAFAAYMVYKHMPRNTKELGARITSAIIAEIIMVGGYFLFEGYMYGFYPSMVNIPANAMQGLAGMIAGIFLVKIFKKNNII